MRLCMPAEPWTSHACAHCINACLRSSAHRSCVSDPHHTARHRLAAQAQDLLSPPTPAAARAESAAAATIATPTAAAPTEAAAAATTKAAAAAAAARREAPAA